MDDIFYTVSYTILWITRSHLSFYIHFFYFFLSFPYLLPSAFHYPTSSSMRPHQPPPILSRSHAARGPHPHRPWAPTAPSGTSPPPSSSPSRKPQLGTSPLPAWGARPRAPAMPASGISTQGSSPPPVRVATAMPAPEMGLRLSEGWRGGAPTERTRKKTKKSFGKVHEKEDNGSSRCRIGARPLVLGRHVILNLHRISLYEDGLTDIFEPNTNRPIPSPESSTPHALCSRDFPVPPTRSVGRSPSPSPNRGGGGGAGRTGYPTERSNTARAAGRHPPPPGAIIAVAAIPFHTRAAAAAHK